VTVAISAPNPHTLNTLGSRSSLAGEEGVNVESGRLHPTTGPARPRRALGVRAVLLVPAVLLALSGTASPAPAFVATGSLNVARYVNSGILLQDGHVLVMTGSTFVTDTSELYDPATGSWSTAGPIGGARSRPANVLLRSGRVLVTGGSLSGGPTRQCRLFDPLTKTWGAAGFLITARSSHTATLLLDGRVLVAGGRDTGNQPTNLAEIYDPTTDSWTATALMTTVRYNHTATLLRDGRVMVTGGRTAGGFITATTEVYDPTAGTWTTVASMSVGRDTHSATMLPDGRVLVVGGLSGASTTATAELFDPGGNWTPTGSLPQPRFSHSATLLPSGLVLVAGGRDTSTYNTTRVYDPTTGLWSNGPDLAFARYDHAATMLPDGRVLIAGGYDASALASAELFDNHQPAWSATTGMAVPRWDGTATLLLNGRVLVAGGEMLDTASVYDPAALPTPTWTPTVNSMGRQRWRHTATLLQDGRVLVTGSRANTAAGRTVDLYDLTSNSWTAMPDMPVDRAEHTATLLPCGDVLIVGGTDSGPGTTIYASALRFDPKTLSWKTTTSLPAARYGAAMTLLADGRVLLTGGFGVAGALDTALLYDPVGETWTPVAGTMKSPRYLHTSTLLPSGKVLLVGGAASATSAEVFDPTTGTFTSTLGAPTVARDTDFTATLLPDGRVLVVGGAASSQRAEVYDPVTDAFTQVPDPLYPRWAHMTSLLLDGRVLVTGGVTAGPTPEIYDVGRGEQVGWRPIIGNTTSPVASGAPLGVNGNGFLGLGQGDTGLGSNQGATNYPLVQLRRLDNEEVRWLPVDEAIGWSGTSFQSVPVFGFTAGPALVTVFTNGIPSVSTAASGECPVPVVVTPPTDLDACLGGTATFTVVGTGGCGPSFQWRKGGTPLVDGGRISGALTDTLQITGALATDAGSYDVVVSAACSSFTATSPPVGLTVSTMLSAPIGVSISGQSTVCPTCSGGTAFESHTGGGPVTYQWGYRTVSGGSIAPIPGQTGSTYVLNGADFPDLGSYLLVVTVSPLCGTPVISEEEPVEVANSSLPSDSVQFFTVTSRDQENVLEWVNASGRDTVRIRYNTGTPCTYPSDPNASGVLLVDKVGPVGGRDGFPHGPLANGTTYCYTMWTDLGSGSYSAGRSNHGRPFATAGAVKWAFSVGVTSMTPPTVGTAAVVATSNDQALHATERGPTGGLWPAGWLPVPIGAPVQSRSPIIPIDVGPLPSNPVVYLAAQDGKVYAVDGAQGGAASNPWSPASIAGMVQGAPAGIFTAFGGAFDYLVVGTRDAGLENALVALDPFTGSEVDRFDNGGSPNAIGVINGTATVDYATERVFFASRAGGSANSLWCLQLDASPNPTFTLVWARNDLGDIDSSPVVRGNRVYVGTDAGGGTLYSIDATNGLAAGDRTYVHGDGPVRGFVWPDRVTDDLYFATDTLVHGVSDDPTLGITPNFAAIALAGGGVTPSPVLVAPGTTWLYVGGSDGKLYEIDVNTAGVKSVTLGDGLAAVGAPSLDRGYDLVQVGTEAGIFYAVQIPLP
jgi:hypothetical protein